jgi:hypothetical protein
MKPAEIPPKTIEKINANQPKGERHKAKIDIAIPLIGNGVPQDEVIKVLRQKFPDASDKEIEGVVQWAKDHNPTPTTMGGRGPNLHRLPTSLEAPKPAPKLKPAEAIKRFMGDAAVDPADCSKSSPIPIPPDPKEQAALTIGRLYSDAELINVVCRYTLDAADKTKAKPKGGGKSLTPSEWNEFIAENGVPQSEAGAWVRPNPCTAGSGADGAITDADITSFRFLLVENDKLPVDIQLAFLRRLKLPVAAIILSGGISAHAWIRLDAADRTDYTAKGARILRMLEPFGFDQANKNPSRLSRLPGAVRQIGAKGEGMQSLLYLDDECQAAGCSDEALDTLEIILRSEFLPENPMVENVHSAIERIEWLIDNQGKIGLKIGIPQLDEVTGGFRRKQMIVLAAESKGGKSALALNIAYFVAVRSAKAVALFTLEMDRDEVTDLLLCMHCRIDRNKFNTGYFFPADTANVAANAKVIADAPLYIFDEPVMTTEDVRSQSQRLKAERELALIIVDYLQLLTPLDTFRDNREQQVASMGRAIRVMAKELDVPVLVLSQLNDEGKLRESRAVGHDAHAIFKLKEEGEDDESRSPYDDRDMILRIQRARSMPRGDYRLRFEPLFCRMTGAHP